jgi:hypothetical protein
MGENWLVNFTLLAAMAAIGAAIGYAGAHDTIAKECDRLGGFYVQSAVYECKRVVGGRDAR